MSSFYPYIESNIGRSFLAIVGDLDNLRQFWTILGNLGPS